MEEEEVLVLHLEPLELEGLVVVARVLPQEQMMLELLELHLQVVAQVVLAVRLEAFLMVLQAAQES